jgi:hypothetical protein
MIRRTLPVLSLICLALSGAGCGVSETAVSAAAGGASEVEQAKQARATEERVKQQLDSAMQAETQHRQAAEAANP